MAKKNIKMANPEFWGGILLATLLGFISNFTVSFYGKDWMMYFIMLSIFLGFIAVLLYTLQKSMVIYNKPKKNK